MSPRASWAKSVMPMRTEPSCSPGLRTHSCSVVYFRSTGYTGTPVGAGSVRSSGCDAGRLLRAVGLGVLGLLGLDDALDVERLELVDLHALAVLLELGPGPLEEGHA